MRIKKDVFCQNKKIVGISNIAYGILETEEARQKALGIPTSKTLLASAAVLKVYGCMKVVSDGN